MARIHPGHPERLLPYSQQYQDVMMLAPLARHADGIGPLEGLVARDIGSDLSRVSG